MSLLFVSHTLNDLLFLKKESYWKKRKEMGHSYTNLLNDIFRISVNRL